MSEEADRPATWEVDSAAMTTLWEAGSLNACAGDWQHSFYPQSAPGKVVIRDLRVCHILIKDYVRAGTCPKKPKEEPPFTNEFRHQGTASVHRTVATSGLPIRRQMLECKFSADLTINLLSVPSDVNVRQMELVARSR